jgi:hypothetical protein
MSVEATNGMCEAETSSRRRNLQQTAYDVTVIVSPAVVDVSAVTASLTTNGITATMMSVDPVDEIALIDGIDLTKIDTFNTAAEEAAAASASYVLAEALAKEAEQKHTDASLTEVENLVEDAVSAASSSGFFTAFTAALVALLA